VGKFILSQEHFRRKPANMPFSFFLESDCLGVVTHSYFCVLARAMVSPLVFVILLSIILVTRTLAIEDNTTALEPRSSSASEFVGYLISTFSDANPTVQFYISKGNDPSNFAFANKAKSVLTSTIGTRAVRDVFLTCN
jgi:hypothetical protein